MLYLLVLSLLAVTACSGQEISDQENIGSDLKCMRPEDARLLRPSLSVPQEWIENQWHQGPYMSISNEQTEKELSEGYRKIKFTSNLEEAEQIWFLEDSSSPRKYFMINRNMTNIICADGDVGLQVHWFERNDDTTTQEYCKWSIQLDETNPDQFKIKNTWFIKEVPEVGFIYFDKTGIYFDYVERARNYPLHQLEQMQSWWTFVKSDPGQRDFSEMEEDCVIGETGLPTFLEETDENGIVTARGATRGQRRSKFLKSKDKFTTCAQNWYLYKGKCYRVFKDFTVSNAQAKKVCNFFHSTMFVPRNKREQGFVMRLVKVMDKRPSYFWLGIEADSQDIFRDSEGMAIQFRRWARSRTSFASDTCAIWRKRWLRADCRSTHKVICEKEATQRLSGSCGKIQIPGADEIMKIAGQKEKEAEGRIVNGAPAEFGQFPWQVGIRYHTPMLSEGHNITHQCGGSIIDECWVVSAGHCFHGGAESKGDFYVRLGDLNNDVDEETEQDFEIEELILHEEYQEIPSPQNDIALIKLRKKNGKCAKFDDFVQPICLPDPNNLENRHGDLCQVSGWGQTDTALGQSSSSKNLMWTTLPWLTPKYCASRYNTKRFTFFRKDIMICAGLKKGGSDSCTGDSGGPYSCRGAESERYSLQGIVSFGIGCARRKYPGVYTNVVEFVPWITNQIRIHGGGNVIES